MKFACDFISDPLLHMYCKTFVAHFIIPLSFNRLKISGYAVGDLETLLKNAELNQPSQQTVL